MRWGFALIIWGCAGATAAAPVGSEICTRLPIFDARDGAAIVGPEDVVFDPENDRFLVAAFDRDQTAPNADGYWSGGLFVLPSAALTAGQATLKRLPGSDPNLRPHGIDIAADGAVWAVHRSPTGAAEARSSMHRIAADGVTRWTDRSLCRANDLFVSPDARRALVTLDRGACGGAGRMAEEVFGLERGGVALVDLDSGSTAPLFSGLDIPNGVAMTAALNGGGRAVEWLAVAETRSKRIRWTPASTLDADIAARPALKTSLAGGPDNINALRDGRGGLLVTSHDDLMRLFAHMKAPGWFDPPGATVSVIWPPSTDGGPPPAQTGLKIPGELYAGATAAAYDGDGLLVVGSAVETGLLVCDWTPPAPTG